MNGAGIAMAMETTSPEDPHPFGASLKVLTVNSAGTFHLTLRAADAMKDNQPNDQGEPSVLRNTTFVTAFDGQIGQAAQSASNGAIWA